LNVLVTGGAGFIGSNLVRRLLDQGDRVRVLDDFSTGNRENLEGIQGNLEVVDADIRDRSACLSACKGMDAVSHQAAVGSVPRSIEDPVTTHDVNVTGTLNMLLAARDCGVKRLVFASSSSVYGDSSAGVKTETLPPRPQSPYATSKLAAEAYTIVFAKVYGLESIALRYFNIFGPRQDPQSDYAAVVPRFATRLLDCKAPIIFGDGEQSRDFTYVENAVQANLLALKCSAKASGRAYNIACGKSTSLKGLLGLMYKALGGKTVEIKPVHKPLRKGDVRESLACVDAARDALGYTPEVDIAAGIRLTLDWYRGRAKTTKDQVTRKSTR
jgi:nucleoside-diphosphate-sugar epimerase